MAWSTSNLSAAGLSTLMGGTWGGSGWASDTIYASLFNNSITPNKNDTLANNTYNAGQWANTNEVYSAGQWAQGGVALATKTNTFGSGTMQLGAASTASGSAATLSGAFGCLVYDNGGTGKYAYCWNYFGGSQSVTSGTFTIVWSGSGILQITVT